MSRLGLLSSSFFVVFSFLSVLPCFSSFGSFLPRCPLFVPSRLRPLLSCSVFIAVHATVTHTTRLSFKRVLFCE